MADGGLTRDQAQRDGVAPAPRQGERRDPRDTMREVTIAWPAERNEHGERMLWFGSWLVGSEGVEAEWFYRGRGGEHGRYTVPPAATGLRIRRWPNEGFDAEYVDVLDLAELRELRPDTLDFDRPQPFSVLPEGNW